MLRTRTSGSELSTEDCLDLLVTRQPPVGRLAFEDHCGPMVVPMIYIAEGRIIHFRTAPGNTLLAALEMRQVTFEIDLGNDLTGPAYANSLGGGRHRPVDRPSHSLP